MDDGRIIVKSQGKVILIGKDGKFIKNISARGRARNEYTSLHDIALSHDGKSVMILDEIKILIVDIESGTTESVSFDELKYPVEAFAPSKDGNIFLFSFYPVNNKDSSAKKFMLSKIDSNGKVVESYFEKDDITFSIDCISQSAGNRYFLRPQNSDHIFCDLSFEQPAPIYRIDFEDKNIPARYYYDVANEDVRSYILSPYFKLPTEMCETDDILSFKASDDKNEWNYIYSKANKRGVSWKNSQGSPSTKIFTSDSEGYFYTFISVDDIENDDSLSAKPLAPLFSYLSKRVKEKYNLNDMESRTFMVRVKFALSGDSN